MGRRHGTQFKQWLQKQAGELRSREGVLPMPPTQLVGEVPRHACWVHRKCTCMWRPHNSSWDCVEQDVTNSSEPHVPAILACSIHSSYMAASDWKFVEDPPEQKRLIFLVPPRSRDAYFVGALPDLSGSKPTVGQPGKKLHEDSMHR